MTPYRAVIEILDENNPTMQIVILIHHNIEKSSTFKSFILLLQTNAKTISTSSVTSKSLEDFISNLSFKVSYTLFSNTKLKIKFSSSV